MNIRSKSPLWRHICTARRCCCCPPISCRCAWCRRPREGRGGTAAPRTPPRGPRRRGSPPGRSGSGTSPWKTVEWSGPPGRQSSGGRRRQSEKVSMSVCRKRPKTQKNSFITRMFKYHYHPRVSAYLREKKRRKRCCF